VLVAAYHLAALWLVLGETVIIARDPIAIRITVGFERGSARLDRRSLGQLADVAQAMLDNPELELVGVEGHASLGEPDGVALSQRRADAVMKELVRRRVPATRLEARGCGDRRPLDDNGTAEGRAKNRRVEFVVYRANGAVASRCPDPTAR